MVWVKDDTDIDDEASCSSIDPTMDADDGLLMRMKSNDRTATRDGQQPCKPKQKSISHSKNISYTTKIIQLLNTVIVSFLSSLFPPWQVRCKRATRF